MRRVVIALLAAALLCAPVLAGSQEPDAATGGVPVRRTVGEFLEEAGVPAQGLPPEALAVTALDFAAEAGAERSAIAYRAEEADGRVRLHVRVLDHAAATWRTAVFDDPEITHGGLTQILEVNSRLVLDLERDPFTGDVLVLDGALVPQARLDGTLVGALPDGSVLFRENLESARPAHPLAVSIYVPPAGSVQRVYPLPSQPGNTRSTFIERVRKAYGAWGRQRCAAAGHPCDPTQFDAAIVSEVRATVRGDRFAWVTRFGAAEGESEGPVTFRAYVMVVCDRGASGSRCRDYAFGEYDGPDGPTTQAALTASLVRRDER